MLNFTLDQLVALDAIARGGSFAAAARELHKVPSAITYLMQELESSLGVALFERKGRGVVITPAGGRLLAAARDTLAQAHALQQVAADLAGAWEAELHVVVDGALEMSPLSACLRRFGQADVPTRLRVDIEYQEGVIDATRRLGADIALYLGFDSREEAEEFECTPLPALTMVLVAHAEHPTAQARFEPGLAGRYAELVVRDSSARYWADSKPSFMGSRNVVYLSDFHSKRLALNAGAGWGWVPEHLVAADIAAGVLVKLDAEQSTWSYEPQIVVPRGRALGSAGRLFVETLLTAVSGQ
jgi:DNA-binding transcriptional LysR family regulator